MQVHARSLLIAFSRHCLMSRLVIPTECSQISLSGHSSSQALRCSSSAMISALATWPRFTNTMTMYNILALALFQYLEPVRGFTFHSTLATFHSGNGAATDPE